MGLVTAKSWHVNKHPEQVFNAKNAYTFGRFLGERYTDFLGKYRRRPTSEPRIPPRKSSIAVLSPRHENIDRS
jgi:hypothetical protein